MITETVGRQVGWARKRAGMTQHDLARAVGMPQPSIARIERGSVVPRTATLIEILRATGHRLVVESIGEAVDEQAIGKQLAMPIPRRVARLHGKDPDRILRRLRRFNVPFVVVGDLAEVVHGSPARIGRDIEVCVATTEVARERLDPALAEIGSQATGRLRVLSETAAGDTYDLLLRNSESLPVEAGIMVRVASLEDLIRVRRARCTPEDRAAADVLEAVVRLTSRPQRGTHD